MMSETLAPGRAAGMATRRLLALDVGPPTLAFVAATVVLMMAAVAGGADFSATSTWTRWDAGIYMTIAHTGYSMFPCIGNQFPPGSWCGNAFLFPGYPLVLAPLYSIGLPTAATAVAVSWIFDFALLVLLWEGFLREISSPLRHVALLFAAFAPGAIYMRAGYPMSMAAFFMLLCLYLLRHRRWFWAALCGSIAAFTYPVAVAIVPIVFAWVLMGERRSALQMRFVRACLCGALAGAGLVATLVAAQVQTGHWNAYFLIQDRYDHGVHLPFTLLLPMLTGPFDGVTYVHGIWDCEAILATAVSACLLLGIGARALRRTTSLQELLIVALVLICWLGPLTQRDISYWRDDTLMLPAAVLLPRLPTRIAIGLAGGAVTMLPLLALFFFIGTLI